MSPLDFARTAKGRGWFVDAVGGPDEPVDGAFPRSTIGFGGDKSTATLLYGRLVSDPAVDDAAGSAARLAAWVEAWAEREGHAIQVIGAGTIRPGERVTGLAVGCVLGQTDADGPGKELNPSLAEAKALLAPAKAAFWKELDAKFGFDLSSQKDATWLIASGPLATACFAYGVRARRKERTKALDWFEGADSAQRAHRQGVVGVVETTDAFRKISLAPAALAKRKAKTTALEEPRFILTARYD